MGHHYDDRYRGEQYRGERRSGRDRGFVERAGDEVRSWFGDEDAERRRRMDEREHGHYGDRAYGLDYGGVWQSAGSVGERRWQGDRRASSYSNAASGRFREPYGASGSRSAPGWLSGSGYTGAVGETSRAYGGQSGTGVARWRGEFTGRGPKGYRRSDARINEDVCDRLADAHDVDASEIEVKVENGDVSLSGTVWDRQQKRRAEELIENISGVREVNNQLRITRLETTRAEHTPTAGATPETIATGRR
jgi:osmotically-inducible protein OsmY